MFHVKHFGEVATMKTNYVDIICKYLTWYKQVRVEVEHEEVYGLPILRVYDDLMHTQFNVYYVNQIPSIFKAIGIWRLGYIGSTN